MAETISRRRVPQFSPVAIAVSLADDRVDGALITDAGRLLTERSVPIRHATVRSIVAAVSQLILDLAALSEREQYEVRAIGINVPGAIDYESERVTFSGRSGYQWERVPLRTLIEDELDKAGVDIRLPLTAPPSREAKLASAHPLIRLCSSRNARAAGEGWCGAAAGKADVVSLSLEGLVSAGILVGGRTVRGSAGRAGGASWFALSEAHKDEYSSSGCLAFEASENALIRRTLEKWAPDSDSVLSKVVLSDPKSLTAGTIVRAARSGDPLALSVVEEVCGWIGRAIANLISLLNPDAVVIDGAFGQLLKPFLVAIRAEAKKWSNPPAFRGCQIAVSKLGQKASLFGAAKLGFDEAEAIDAKR